MLSRFQAARELRKREYGILLIEAHVPRAIDAVPFAAETVDNPFSQKETEGVDGAVATLRIAGVVSGLDVDCSSKLSSCPSRSGR
jgi:hypothetical protein